MEALTNQYGYDDSLFISATQDFLHCCICTLVLRDPVMIISCGHKFCYVCFQRLRDFSVTNSSDLHCPLDRNVVDLSKVHEDIAMRHTVGSLLVRCPEHESGCQWTGYLSDMNNHHEQCRYNALNPGNATASLPGIEMTEINDLLDSYEKSLFEKDKENKKLKQEILLLKREQQQQQKEQRKQQQEKTVLREQNVVLVKKSTIGKLSSKVDALQKELAFHFKGGKVIPLQHHTGEYGSTIILADRNTVVFRGRRDIPATVSAPTGVVPPRGKVWYEVVCNRNRHGWILMGWATNYLPKSTFVLEWVGKSAHSYGYQPFTGHKWHQGSKEWGAECKDLECVFGVAIDRVKREVLFSVGGKWMAPWGIAFTGISNREFFPAVSGGEYTEIHLNFGERPFHYGPPDPTYKSLVDALVK